MQVISRYHPAPPLHAAQSHDSGTPVVCGVLYNWANAVATVAISVHRAMAGRQAIRGIFGVLLIPYNDMLFIRGLEAKKETPTHGGGMAVFFVSSLNWQGFSHVSYLIVYSQTSIGKVETIFRCWQRFPA